MADSILSQQDCVDLHKKGLASPKWWVETALGGQCWPKQYEIMEAVRDNRHTAVKSCHSAGKDYTAARVALWYLYNHEPSIVITTGPTLRQVKGILWKEIAVAFRGARWDLGGRLLQQELKLAPNWWAWGFTAADTDPDRFQGFHEEDILVIIDEASGVSSDIYLAVDGILTSENARRLEIGNPTDPASSFAGSFKKPRVKKISISAFDTPNFTTFGITEEDIVKNKWREKITGKLPFPTLITPQWVRDKFEDWGLNNPLFRSRVLAEFPSEGVDTLISLAWIEAAQRRTLEPTEPITLGVDVAVEGDDLCVIGLRTGGVYRKHSKFGKVDTMTTTGHVVRALDETKAEIANVDVVGVGAGVVHRLGELGKPVAGASAGKNANDPEKYANQRSEWFWGLRCRFESQDIDLDPHDEDLAAQLCAIRWKPDSRGRVQLQKKELMKKDIGCSPDDADAMAIAFARVSRFSFSFGIDDDEETEQDAIEAMRALVNQGEAMVSAEAIEKAKAIRRDATPAFATDILVKTSNPESLHATLRGALAGVRGVELTLVLGLGTPDGPVVINDCNVVRVVGDAEQVEKVMTAHGYAEVVGRRERPRSLQDVVDAEASSGNLIDEDLMDDGRPQPLMGLPVIQGTGEDW